ncbi:MAG: polysaccharide biosynthesis/export family protein [Longimicrobiales bacterium]
MSRRGGSVHTLHLQSTQRDELAGDPGFRRESFVMKSSMVAAGALAALLVGAPAFGQTTDPWDPGRLHATREQLQELLAEYEKASSSKTYSEHMRLVTEDQAELIRTRLLEGDFQVGDQIVLAVNGQTTLTATFTVSEGPVLMLPDIGDIPLKGLLRSELRQALTDSISRYVRNPQIQAQSNIRLAVFGNIGTPGYHVAASDKLLTDFLMQAGGPTGGANQKKLKIKRAGEVIWEGEPLQEAIVQGRTLDQLNLRAGDEIEVPGPGTSVRSVLGVLRAVPYMVAGLFALSRLF